MFLYHADLDKKPDENEFQCDQCGGVFPKVQPDEEALDEALDLWDVEEWAEGAATICEDCFFKLMCDMPSKPTGVPD